MGWEEIARAPLPAKSIAQHWSTATGSAAGTELARQAVSRGARLVMSPANRAYLDMKYRASTPLGLAWAGFVEVRDAYDWDPARLIDGVRERNVAGVESALWSETHRGHRRRRVHELPAAAGDRRDRVVAQSRPQLARVPPPARRSGPALEGAGRALLPLAAGAVGKVSGRPRAARFVA